MDRAFALSPDAAAGEIERAAQLWEDAVGRALFRHDPADGFPIRFVDDGRQAATIAVTRRESATTELRDQVDAELAALERRVEGHDEARTRLDQRLRDYESRAAAHNRTVTSWNERGGAPEEIGRRLGAAEEAFAEELSTLEGEARVLDAELGRIRQEEDRLRRTSAEVGALARAIPSGSIESGEYREAVRGSAGETVSVSREIRIYRFADPVELRLIAAHELGHALGLGHSPVAGALMHEEQLRGAGTSSAPSIHASDADQLLTRCPRLTGESPGTRSPEALWHPNGV